MLLVVAAIAVCTLASTIIRQPDNYYSSWHDSQTIAILTTNDLHGAVLPRVLRRTDTLQQYQSGGLTYLGEMLTTLRKQFGQRNVLYLDAGDQFQGAIESGPLVSRGEILTAFFNEVGLTASAIGNHEFDFGGDFLFNYMRKRKAPFLAANIFNEVGLSAKEFLPNTLPSMMVTVGNGIKIGLVGLTTKFTLQTSTGFTDGLFPQFQFRQHRDILLAESRKLRDAGANCVVLVAHVGTRCPKASMEHSNRTNSHQQEECLQDELTELLDSLPASTIDAVVAGHRHEIVHHYYRGVPVVCSRNAGAYFHVLYLKFRDGRLDQTTIEGPVPICEKVFELARHCEYLTPKELEQAGRLISWKFHNTPVIASHRLNGLFASYQTALAPYHTKLADNYVHLMRIKQEESELGNLFAELLHAAAVDHTDSPPDFAIINVGTFRTSWLPGPLLYKDVYNMVPFENLLVTCQISGGNLEKMLRQVHRGNWTYGFRGLSVRLTRSPYEVVQVLTEDGGRLVAERQYTFVTTDFLLDGGEGFHGLQGYFRREDIRPFGGFREHIAQQIAKKKVIAAGYFDPKKPRMAFIDAFAQQL